jgi:hypothetical protein
VLTLTREQVYGKKPETEAERAARKVVEREIRREQKRVQLALHKIHLLSLTAALLFRNRVCNEAALQAVALSRMPLPLVKIAAPEARFLDGLAAWFAGEFKVRLSTPLSGGSQDNPVKLDSSDDDGTGPADHAKQKLVVLVDEAGDEDEDEAAAFAQLAAASPLPDKMQLCQLLRASSRLAGSDEDGAAVFTALCRALGLQARLVVALQPEPGIRAINRIGLEPAGRKKARTGAAQDAAGKIATAIDQSVSHLASAAPPSSSPAGLLGKRRSSTQREPLPREAAAVRAWTEVYVPRQARWVYVNGLTGTLDRSAEVEELGRASVHYVLGIDGDGYVSDITERYAHKWLSATFKYRVKDKWWQQSLAPLRNPSEERAREEKADMEEAQVSVSLPTSFAAFKNHKLYALERFLLKFEAIHPRGPILGYCKGEPVFRRDCVQALRSRESWIKEGRSIKPDEVCAKSVLRRGVRSGGKGGAARGKRASTEDQEHGGDDIPDKDVAEDEAELAGAADEHGRVALFGLWQTEPYRRPIASDGVVPLNAFGNVDLYKPEMLPINTTHLTEPGMAAVARELRIHHADAVVGFDFAAGRSFPVKDGIVVCSEYAQLLREVWAQKQQVVVDTATEERSKIIIQRWRRLVSQLLLHSELKERYFKE